MNPRGPLWHSGAVVLAAALAAGCANPRPEADLRAHRIEQAVVPMARAALAAGQVETARRLYTRLLDVAPDAVEARMGLGDVALAGGRPRRAATWYLDAAGLAQDRAGRHGALLAHGRASVTAGDLEGARRSFERLIDPEERARPADAAWGHNGMAVVAMLEGDPTGTVAAVERAVLLLPDEQRFRNNLARAVAIADAYPSDVAEPRDSPAETLLAQAVPGGLPTGDQGASDPHTDPAPEGLDAGIAATDAAEPAEASAPPRDDDPAPAADVDTPVQTAEAVPAPAAEEDRSGDPACPGTPPQACAVAAPLPGQEPAVADTARPAPRDSNPLPQDDAPQPRETDHDRGLPPVADDAVASRPGRGAVGDTTPDEVEAAAMSATDALGEAPLAPDPVTTAGPEALAVPVATDGARPETPSRPAADGRTPVVGFLVAGADGDYLQVGAFAVAANAQSLAEGLPGVTDLPVDIQPPGDGQVPALYRVRIGPIPSRARLPRLMQALRDGAIDPAGRPARTAATGHGSAATS